MNKKAFEKLFKENRRYSSFVIVKTLNATIYADSYSFDKDYPKEVFLFYGTKDIGYCELNGIIEVM